jgi:plasmid segregation protein ParM
MILGVDLGNVNVKTSTRLIYPNRNTTDERLCEDKENTIVEFDGIKYVIGTGEYQTIYQKAQKKDTLLNLFTAIALSTHETFNEVVIGLPIQQYKNDKELLEKYIYQNMIKDICIKDEKTRKVIITDFKVFPEGLATYYSLDQEMKTEIGNRDLIIIDIGGRTTDICLYSIVNGKRKLQNYTTIAAGTLNIYSDFVQTVNDKYGLDKLKEEAPQILSQGLWVDGEKVNLKFTKPIFIKYTERILSELRLNYPIRTAFTILCGGGGSLLRGLFRNQIKGIQVIDDIFCNTIGFQRVGESLWNSSR